MYIRHNYLRWYRKKSQLFQEDVAYIFEMGDINNISRWERGMRRPRLYTLLAYHILFDTSIQQLFERQLLNLKRDILLRSKERLDYLETLKPDKKVEARISYLKEVVGRLTAPKQ